MRRKSEKQNKGLVHRFDLSFCESIDSSRPIGQTAGAFMEVFLEAKEFVTYLELILYYSFRFKLGGDKKKAMIICTH